MKNNCPYISIICLLSVYAGICSVPAESKGTMEDYTAVNRFPSISPDYTDIVIPSNIAPLNFKVNETGSRFFVRIYSEQGSEIKITSKAGKIKIPVKKWRKLLSNNCGKKLFYDVYTKGTKGQWLRYNTFANTIASDRIDSHIAYRLIKPIFNRWFDIKIYQRNLENYDESLILNGQSMHYACVNCHSFLNNDSDQMFIGIRSQTYGSSAILARNGQIQKIDTKFGYTAWHPSGRLAAYSTNKIRQFFHTAGMEVRDVIDIDSALCYYMIESQQVKTDPKISLKNRLETYPTWSPDGKTLYFCSAPKSWTELEKIPPKYYQEIKYDLMRISYDVETDKWGELETVLSSDETGLSILLPRISPDGRFLLFSMCNYGCFPVYQPSSDLYLMDLGTKEYRKLEISSKYSESWHSFSSNGRWIAFSSKRRGGMFTRIYFSYIDKNGRVYKQFIMPQKDPTFYDSFFKTYSVPELITSSVKVNSKIIERVERLPEKIDIVIPFTSASPEASVTEPWQEHE